MSDPSNGRLYSDQEFALILRKASELGLKGPAAARSSDGLSLGEMQEIAREAGIDPELLARAVALLPTATASTAARILGGPAKYRMVQTIPGELPQEEMGRIAETIREILKHQGKTAEVLFGGVEWQTVGEVSVVAVNVSARNGETRVEVTVDRGGSGFLSYFFPFLPIAIATGAVGAGLGVDSVLGVLASITTGLATAGLLGRTIFAAGTRKWNEKVPRLMGALTDTVREGLPRDSDESGDPT